MNAIEVSNLDVYFDGKRILGGLSLEVERGTVCALLGPNGAGKTTLIKTLVNIYPRRKGRSSILGVDSQKLAPADFEKIGYVSESQDLPLWMTVKDFLSFCEKLYGNWDRAWVNTKLEEMDLVNHLGTPLSKLSRGMRVKASLISSLAYHPELLILDEPFSGLDPIVRDEFIDAVIQLAAEVNATTLISSHDLAEVERIADSIAFLHKGMIIRHSALDQLLASYRHISIEGATFVKESIPATWANPSVAGSIIQFVHTAYSDGTVEDEISAYSADAKIKAVEELSLKEIYRVMIGKGFGTGGNS